MKIRIVRGCVIEGRNYGDTQQLEIDPAVGALVVASGDADVLPDDTSGCFVAHMPAAPGD